jgi:putative addiction module killer protein
LIELRKTREFDRWFDRLRDRQAQSRIHGRLLRLGEGNPGDQKAVGEGVWELRIHYGPGYRLYYTQRGPEWILLLAGGDKDSQEKDIRLALKLARTV